MEGQLDFLLTRFRDTVNETCSHCAVLDETALVDTLLLWFRFVTAKVFHKGKQFLF